MRLLFVLLASAVIRAGVAAAESVDVVIYGGTPGGITAAIQTARMGRSVVLIEPGRHLGGTTAGGLSYSDFGNKKAIGGIAREFFQRVYRHYAGAGAWTRETFEEFRQRAGEAVDADTLWAFEPHVAEQIFRQMLAEAGVQVVLGDPLNRNDGVRREGTRISAIGTKSGRIFSGRVFIDAGYEGDLMAAARVSYSIGREANAQYGETLNGIQAVRSTVHQFVFPIDPYIKPGDPQSGLLPGVHAGGPGEDGQADRRVQAYNFRMCLTDVPDNRLAFPKPSNYDPLRYEVLLRYVEAGWQEVLANRAPAPNRKSDTNNHGAFSTDNIGMSDDYPDGDDATRVRIIAEHRDYQLGLMWTLANDSRVPSRVREEVNRWGLAKDEFTDNGNWPHQIYVREGRRMKGPYVMIEQNWRGSRVAEDSVGLGSYTMDVHHVQRYVDARGHARNEGDLQQPVLTPYPISYRSLTPKAGECTNLLVPVCLSASHVGYGSLRMEPVYMVLGQSAATAAVQAIEAGCDVQAVDYGQLRARLLKDGQILDWPPTITRSPANLTVTEGEPATFTVVAVSANSPSYQWHRDGLPISGATNSTYAIVSARVADTGAYTCVVTNGSSFVMSSAGSLTVRPGNFGRLTNLSIRATTGAGSETLIVGLVLGGGGTSGSKGMLFRAGGPALLSFGVLGALQDPLLSIYDGGGRLLNSNDNWGSPLESVFARAGAFAFPTDSKDSAVSTELAGGRYTAQVASINDTRGIALAEVYDTSGVYSSSSPRLINLSARAWIAPDSGTMIAGFVIQGVTRVKLLIRAVGPTLGAFGVSPTLANPRLTLSRDSAIVGANDDWGDADSTTIAGAAVAVGAFTLPIGSRDAALVATLDPGSYTVQVTGVPGTTGAVLVEVYEVP